MEEKLISVIIPIYNCDAFLNDCLESVLAQTYKNLEIILVDDGSTDMSSAICDDYVKRDNRFRKYSKTNGGLSSARNYGLDKATGDYVIFLDSDDFWCDNSFLERLIDVAIKTNADIIRGELKEVNEFGKDIFGYKIPESRIKNSNRLLSSGDFFESVMCRDFFVVLSLYKAQILDKLRFNEDHKFQEDIEFHIRLFIRNWKCVYIPICFYAYRRREGSLTTEINVNKLKFSFLLADVYDTYSEMTADIKVRERYKTMSVMMYYWTLGTLSESPYYQHRMSIIKELSLKDLQLRTRRRVFKNKLWNRACVVACVSPKIGVRLMKIKNYVTLALNNSFSHS